MWHRLLFVILLSSASSPEHSYQQVNIIIFLSCITHPIRDFSFCCAEEKWRRNESLAAVQFVDTGKQHVHSLHSRDELIKCALHEIEVDRSTTRIHHAWTGSIVCRQTAQKQQLQPCMKWMLVHQRETPFTAFHHHSHFFFIFPSVHTPTRHPLEDQQTGCAFFEKQNISF